MARLILFSLINLFWLSSILVAATDSAGQIGKIRGSGVLERGNDVVVGDKGIGVQSLDTAVTARGTMQIDFIDDTRVDLTEHSRLLIDEFVYDPANGIGKLSIKASLGGIRYASGQIAKNFRQNVNIRTPSATINVRGTDFAMVVDELGGSMITLLPSCNDQGVCYTGEIEVETDAGMVIMNQSFQSTMTSTSNHPPSKPLILDIEEHNLTQLLILRKRTPYEDEEAEIMRKARAQYDFLGIDMLEFDGLDADALQDSIDGIWSTQLDETDYIFADVLYDMLDALNAALMARLSNELDIQNSLFFKQYQTGIDLTTGIQLEEWEGGWEISREDNGSDNYFRLRLDQNYGYTIDMEQQDFEYYDYRLGTTTSNSITIIQREW
jgi:hypothetical protein